MMEVSDNEGGSRMTWNPTPDYGTWTCDCGHVEQGYRVECTKCGMLDTERECEQ